MPDNSANARVTGNWGFAMGQRWSGVVQAADDGKGGRQGATATSVDVHCMTLT